ncbi:hypothetical protein [Gordonia phthalatica]|uniref:Uncharacterized protein n=1 Tax=Gordonia phthalatica TaxID=1136941 RepID=A0A0N9MTF6_9ACTN|nr:hypothetical protein [Gordonia phthalatica]ALG86403.1 hypothetical protein ACH46_20285 [Gordonia phthalatica]
MKRFLLAAVIPPVVVGLLLVLLLPASLFSPGVIIALIFVLLFYIVMVWFPTQAPGREASTVYSGSYELLVWPYFVAAVIIAAIALVPVISWKWILAADIVTLGLFISIAMSAKSTSERDAALTTENKAAVADLRRMALHVQNVAAQETDPVLKKRARQVAEQISMSPFKGVPGSASTEWELQLAVDGLASAASRGESGATLEKISRLIDQRNRIVKTER